MDLSKYTEVEGLLTRAESLAEKFEIPPIFELSFDEKAYADSKLKIIWVQQDKSVSDCSTSLLTNQNELSNKTKVWRALNTDSAEANKTDPNILDEIPVICISDLENQNLSAKRYPSEFYKKSKHLIVQILEALEPNVVIFGETYPFFESELRLNQMNSFGTCHATAKSGRIYINADHPNASMSDQDYFEDILKGYTAFKKQIDNSYPDALYENDLEILKNKISNSLNQIEKIEASLLKTLQYERLVDIKPIKDNLEQALIDINKKPKYK
jgi:hypothetical protein